MDIPAFESRGDIPAATLEYATEIRAAQGNPRRLEDLFQAARRTGQASDFAEALAAACAEHPDDMLYLAWRYRLESAEAQRAGRLGAGWRLAIVISVALALIFWATSSPTWTTTDNIPMQVYVWPLLAALALVWYLALAGGRSRARYALAIGATLWLAALGGYVFVIERVPHAVIIGAAPAYTDARLMNLYEHLMMLHLPLLAWAAVGLAALGLRFSARDLFGLLTKSLETIGAGGVFVIAGVIFVGLTAAMFQTLGVQLPLWVMRLLVAGGAGLLPALAVASVYDPSRRAGAQDFYRGFGKILVIVTRILLPLTIVTLLIYIAFIPANFFAPFNQRNVLITYNVGLFAVIGLLVGVIPISVEDVAPRLRGWLRAGIIALAALALLVSLYAVSAILYRTALDGLTINRLVVIGWNMLNIALLALALLALARAGRGDGWAAALQRGASGGALAYIVWSLALTLALPWIF